MEVINIINAIINILIFVIGYSLATYCVDRKDFNKGVCPKCGKPFMLESKEGVFNIYRCGKCLKIASVTNPYLNWRYGRKLKKTICVKEILKQTYKPVKEIPYLLEPRPRIECNDGFNFSMQAGFGMYCEPKKNLKNRNYVTVELGFLSEPDSLLEFFAEDKEDYTNTIYPYVPVFIVDALIYKHGGVKRLYR